MGEEKETKSKKGRWTREEKNGGLGERQRRVEGKQERRGRARSKRQRVREGDDEMYRKEGGE